MAHTTVLAAVKDAVRVINTAVDDDFNELINACKSYLKAQGISEDKVDTATDPETIQACKLYVMYRIDYEGKGERFKAHFDEYVNFLRSHVDFLEDEEEDETDV